MVFNVQIVYHNRVSSNYTGTPSPLQPSCPLQSFLLQCCHLDRRTNTLGDTQRKSTVMPRL